MSEIQRAQPSLDIVGPTVDDDLRRVIARYGRDAVQEAMQRSVAKRRGRKPVGDWQLLESVLKKDAERWLEGVAPLNEQSNRSIAQALAIPHPEHARVSIERRVMKKLSRRRRYHTLIYAEAIAYKKSPYVDYLGILEALSTAGELDATWQKLLQIARSNLSDYTRKFGLPPDCMTMQDVETGSRRVLKPQPVGNSTNILQVLLGPTSE